MDRNLNLLTLNACGLSAHTISNLKRFLDVNNIDIICIQETKFNQNSIRNIPGFTLENKIYKNKNDNCCGGLATFFKHGLNYKKLDIDNARDQNGETKIEIQMFEIYLSENSHILANIYSRGCDLESLNSISSFISAQSELKELVITGDFNSHHPLWGAPRSDSHGKAVYDWVEQQEFVLLNDGSPTRLDPARGTFTCLDLTFTSTKLSSKMIWQVIYDNWGTDHFPILISLINSNSNSNSNTHIDEKFIFDKADWEQFKILCEDISLADVYHDNVDQFNKLITDRFLSAAKCSIPVTKKVSSIKMMVPWWSDSCESAVKERKKALNNLKRNPCEVNWVTYQDKVSLAKSIILESKKRNWLEFCESCVHDPKNSKDFWQKVRRIKGNSYAPVPVLTSNGQNSISPSDKANMLVRHYSKVSSETNVEPEVLAFQQKFEVDHFEEINSPGETSNSDPINLDFTLNELKDCINSRKNSASGLDKISYQMFKNMSDSTLNIWLFFFNKIWKEGSYPRDWKLACVIPLQKKNKDPADPKSYRPISLTSHPGKLLEGMVKARLESYLESENIINPFQSGFRKGRSTLDQLVRLQHDVLYAKNRGRSVVAIFLDLEAAFDLAWHSGILYKLKKCGITGRCFQYIRAFLLDRKITVKVGDTLSEAETLTRGTPQGAILSPLLFSLLVNDLPVATEGTGMVISQFADDSGGWLVGSDGQTLQRKAQAGLDSIWRWSQEWGFKISKTKTVGIIFGNKNLKELDVYLGDTKIKFEETVTFLGMLLDRKFSLLSHIKQLTEKCQRDLNLMRMLRGTDFGSDKNSLLLLYKSLIRPKLDYGAIVFACASKTALKMLDNIQRKALIIALRALPSTPSVYLELEAGIEPLTLRREAQQIKYWARISSKPGNPVNAIVGKGFFAKSKFKNPALPFGATTASLVEEHLPGVSGAANSGSRFAAPWLLVPPKVDISLSSKLTKSDPPSHILAITEDHVNSSYAEHLKIYTDGSKNENSAVSAAMVIPALKVKTSKRLSDRLSIYAAELTAIKYALNWTLVNKPHKVAILSDSLSALQSLSLRNSNSRPDLLENILSIYDQCHLNKSEVTFVWCPAHVGFMGNEIADDAAKRALEGPVGEKIPLATKELYSMTKISIKEKWSKGLAQRLKGQPYHGSGVSFRPPHSYSTNKRVDKCVTRLRLGYNLLPGSLGHHIIGGSAICPTCGVRNSTEHFLLDCSVHSVARRKFSSALFHEDTEFNIFNILFPSRALRSSTFKALETYLIDCQMTDKI